MPRRSCVARDSFERATVRPMSVETFHPRLMTDMGDLRMDIGVTSVTRTALKNAAQAAIATARLRDGFGAAWAFCDSRQVADQLVADLRRVGAIRRRLHAYRPDSPEAANELAQRLRRGDIDCHKGYTVINLAVAEMDEGASQLPSPPAAPWLDAAMNVVSALSACMRQSAGRPVSVLLIWPREARWDARSTQFWELRSFFRDIPCKPEYPRRIPSQ